MVKDYWILCILGIVTVFGILYGYRIVEDFMTIGKESEFGIEYVYRIV